MFGLTTATQESFVGKLCNAGGETNKGVPIAKLLPETSSTGHRAATDRRPPYIAIT